MADPNAEAQQRVAIEQHRREVDEIVGLGRQEYGSQVFDDLSRTVAEKLGPRTDDFLTAARHYDFPHRLIEKLAGDPDQLERLQKMPPARMLVEMSRIEARMNPHGQQATTGDMPAWKSPAARGRVSDQDWKRGFGDSLTDDQFDKEFWRRQADRKRR